MSGINRLPWWVWTVPAGLLILATSHLPYGYYTFLRIVVCGFAGLVAFNSWADDTVSPIWSVVFVGMAVLFNPLVPIYLSRADWFYVDIGAAVVIVAHLLAMRIRLKQTS
ncbi:DUF6804 family protein [Bradyrhizobium brasilense]|uniref:SPW repeat-containing protein n=1 Tax=Bradyrhizobium brasilense TaxID=1419277 RepID=A0ABY8JAV3_9BRAD|nr:DUF6804 family protein [Bradyrhizobium brasilense]WFU62692.1 hypothetical protein QA636_35470 [Bradyrhizobium brasilense]